MTTINRAGAGLSLAALIWLSAASVNAGDWPQFRGPGGTGVSSETGLPQTWSRDKNIRWRAPLPAPGNSSPIVHGRHVYVTVATDEGHQRHLVCFNRRSGERLWQQTVEYPYDEVTHKTNPQCSPSPAADDQRVVVWYGSAGVHCYDHDGNPLWSRDLGKFEHIWGYAASPIIYGDKVLMNCGPGVRSFVTALDAQSGETIWQTDQPGGASGLEEPAEGERPEWIGSWSTPVIARVDGRDQVLVSMPHRVQAYDPQTGDVIWRCEGLSELVYTSVVLGDDVIVAMSGYRGPALALRPGGSGDVTDERRLWRVADGNPQRIGSGVILSDHLFMANEPGIGECIEVRSGRQLWRSRLPGGNIWGSVLAAEGRLYVTNQAGDTLVFAPNAEKFELLAVNSLGEDSNSTPAFSDGQIFIRTFEALYCIDGQ